MLQHNGNLSWASVMLKHNLTSAAFRRHRNGTEAVPSRTLFARHYTRVILIFARMPVNFIAATFFRYSATRAQRLKGTVPSERGSNSEAGQTRMFAAAARNAAQPFALGVQLAAYHERVEKTTPYKGVVAFPFSLLKDSSETITHLLHNAYTAAVGYGATTRIIPTVKEE
jgi:hypothetical protein